MDDDTAAVVVIAGIIIFTILVGFGTYVYVRDNSEGSRLFGFQRTSAVFNGLAPIYSVQSTAVMNVPPITGNLKTYILSMGFDKS
jgi:hypothetical protein